MSDGIKKRDGDNHIVSDQPAWPPIPTHKLTGAAAFEPWLRGQGLKPASGNNYIGDSLARLARYEAALRRIADQPFKGDDFEPALVAREALDG